MGVIAEWQTVGAPAQDELQERYPALADALDDLVVQHLRELGRAHVSRGTSGP
jgi:hypothetical protein